MTDKPGDDDTFNMGGTHHRDHAFGEIGNRRFTTFTHAVADVIKQPDLKARIENWLHEFAKLRTAPAPAVAHHDGGAPAVAKLPCRQFADGRSDRDAAAILQMSQFRWRMRVVRRCDEALGSGAYDPRWRKCRCDPGAGAQ